jgi:hypothetical protein
VEKKALLGVGGFDDMIPDQVLRGVENCIYAISMNEKKHTIYSSCFLRRTKVTQH